MAPRDQAVTSTISPNERDARRESDGEADDAVVSAAPSHGPYGRTPRLHPDRRRWGGNDDAPPVAGEPAWEPSAGYLD
jgi:hypothetical protein